MTALHWIARVASALLCNLILMKASKRRAGFVLARAAAAIAAAILVLLGVGLVTRSLGIRPSEAFLKLLFQLAFTVLVVAMLNGFNVVSRGMIEAQIAFHERYNAANLKRFPVNFVLEKRDHLKLFAMCFWGLNSVLALYAVWLKMQL